MYIYIYKYMCIYIYNIYRKLGGFKPTFFLGGGARSLITRGHAQPIFGVAAQFSFLPTTMGSEGFPACRWYSLIQKVRKELSSNRLTWIWQVVKKKCLALAF